MRVLRLSGAAATMAFGLIVWGGAQADEGPALSYTKTDPDKAVVEQVDKMIAWARAELAEHDGEGLYDRRPEDKALVEQMLKRAEALQQKAGQAQGTEALSYHYAAEATARYAAQMPHILEDRLEGHGHGDNH